MQLKFIFSFLTASTFIWGCGNFRSASGTSDSSGTRPNKPMTLRPNASASDSVTDTSVNRLTPEEKKSGWKLLFNGVNLEGWKGYNADTIGSAWKVTNGTLVLDQSDRDQWKGNKGGDLITKEEFENFELQLDWKISKNGNSGILFNVVENKKYNEPYFTGPEMQILDNEGHPDGKIYKHKAGDLYDLIASPKPMARAVGQWNTARIQLNKDHLTLFLNGAETATVTMHSPAWDKLVKASKFSVWPDFGKSAHGKIDLQDHGATVYFRNVKIKELK